MGVVSPSQYLAGCESVYSKSHLVYESEKWFDRHHIKKLCNLCDVHPESHYFFAGKIFTYNYDPKYKDKLDFYDNMPMMMSLGQKLNSNPVLELGINLSFIPPKIRLKVLDKIYDTFKNQIEQNKKNIRKGKFGSQIETPFYYDVAKKILNGSGFEFAIRSYLYEKMLTKPEIICYEDWWRLGLIGSKYIQKMNKQAIYFRYKKNLDDGYKIGDKDKDIIL